MDQTVLCVEDEAISLKFLTSILEKRFRTVLIARDGEAGLELFKQHRPFLVISDIEMPKMDGLTLSRHIKELDPTTKIVIATSHSEMESLKTAHMVGITDYVVKPIHPDRLNTVIDRCEKMHALEHAVRISNRQVDTILESIQDIFFALDKQWGITYMNGMADKHFKIYHNDLIGSDYVSLYGHTAGMETLVEAMGSKRMQVFELLSDFTNEWFEVRTFPLDDGGISVYMRNIDALKKSEEELRFMAFFDKLTSLPNRASLQRHLTETVARCKRHEQTAAVLFMDLDRFKFINDTLGHEVGDLVLIEVANRLRNCIRETDFVARFGGDEFVIVIDCMETDNQVQLVVQRIFNALSKEIIHDTANLNIGTSIGISLFPTDATTPEDLLKNSDVAMFYSKSTGRNMYHFYQAEMNARTEMFLKLEAALKKADYDSEFFLMYQPKINLKTNDLVGFEVLVRWQHPELGLISPLDFIPLAEETGLIIPLGDWIFKAACKQGAKWASVWPFFSLAINLSGRQFWQGDLIKTAIEATTVTGFSPTFIELEITEGVVIRNIESAIKKMHDLVEMGFQLSMDDFGTGHSSLSALKQFPLNSLKIDKSFVKDMTTNSNASAISDAIIHLAHAMKLTVVAEGVETDEQRKALLGYGCDIGQGYFFSWPLNASDIENKYFTTT